VCVGDDVMMTSCDRYVSAAAVINGRGPQAHFSTPRALRRGLARGCGRWTDTDVGRQRQIAAAAAAAAAEPDSYHYPTTCSPASDRFMWRRRRYLLVRRLRNLISRR